MKIFTLPCETCGHPIVFVQSEDGGPFNQQPHHECETPIVTMQCDYPQRVGVITNIGEP